MFEKIGFLLINYWFAILPISGCLWGFGYKKPGEYDKLMIVLAFLLTVVFLYAVGYINALSDVGDSDLVKDLEELEVKSELFDKANTLFAFCILGYVILSIGYYLRYLPDQSAPEGSE